MRLGDRTSSRCCLLLDSVAFPRELWECPTTRAALSLLISLGQRWHAVLRLMEHSEVQRGFFVWPVWQSSVGFPYML